MRAHARRIGLLIAAVAVTGVGLPSKGGTAGTDPTPPSTVPDKPFGQPTYLIHAIGHGTTSGDVVDDFLAVYNQEPDGEGHFLTADGSGGTVGWASDYHSGPYDKPSDVCAAAAGRLPKGNPVIGGFGGYFSIDCSLYDPSLTVPATTEAPDTTLSGKSTDTTTVDT